MNRDAYKKALRSAAQLTFISALGGCASSDVISQSDENSPEQDQSDVLSRPRRDAGAKDASKKPATLAECKVALKQAFPKGDPDWFSFGVNGKKDRVATSVDDASLVACCKKMGDRIESANSANYLQSVEDYRGLGCCELRPEGSACTPWGPPMPPVMKLAHDSQVRGFA